MLEYFVMATPSPTVPRTRRFGWWAFGFGLATLLAAFFVPVVQPGSLVLGYPPLKLLVLALGAVTLVFVVIAHVTEEDRRLYTIALGLAACGVFFEYFLAALLVTIVIWVIFGLLLG
jgi:heme/copper-type cytochrome/quinol oxidase subunit 1